MGLRTIVSLPDPVLRRKARPVTRFDSNLQTLIEDMIEMMRVAPGVGLAAPQVNVSERLIVIEYAEHEDDEDTEEKPAKKKLYVMANPEIIKTSEETVPGVEGCLSVPGVVGEVERFSMVQVKGLNRHGKPMKVKVEGWLARIFQHEIDHVNGIVFPDRATRVWKPESDEIEDLV
ncbi:MAG: peptide deformylase [Anaerolineales bacterium]|nr:peptide deformylase [Anaerolineales bacterium]